MSQFANLFNRLGSSPARPAPAEPGLRQTLRRQPSLAGEALLAPHEAVLPPALAPASLARPARNVFSTATSPPRENRAGESSLSSNRRTTPATPPRPPPERHSSVEEHPRSAHKQKISTFGVASKLRRADSPVARPDPGPITIDLTLSPETQSFAEKTSKYARSPASVLSPTPACRLPTKGKAPEPSRVLVTGRRTAEEEFEEKGVQLVDIFEPPSSPVTPPSKRKKVSKGKKRTVPEIDEESSYLAEAGEEWEEVCNCSARNDTTSNFGVLIQCFREDQCTGAQWYHPECIFPQVGLPLPDQNLPVNELKNYFSSIQVRCPYCNDDRPNETKLPGSLSTGKHPTAPKRNFGRGELESSLPLADFDYAERKWFSNYTHYTSDSILRGVTYRCSGTV